MFWRKQGQRFLLLHNERDGRGKVLQRRLFACGASELAAALTPRGWAELQDEVRRRCPRATPDWKALRAKAHELGNAVTVRQRPPSDRVLALRRAVGRLRSLLEKETDPQVLETVEPDLAVLTEILSKQTGASAWSVEEARPKKAGSTKARHATGMLRASLDLCRRRLPPGRRRFEPDDPEGTSYLQALDNLADHLESAGRWAETAEVLRERLKACPQSEVAVRLGGHLARLGRWEEALDCFRRLPYTEAIRHYNEGAILLRSGRQESALQCFLRAMARDRRHVRYQLQLRKAPLSLHPDCWRTSRTYWEASAPLWTEANLEFLLRVGRDPAPNFAITELEGRAPRARKVLSPWARRRLLERVLAESALKGPSGPRNTPGKGRVRAGPGG